MDVVMTSLQFNFDLDIFDFTMRITMILLFWIPISKLLCREVYM